jgi:hypothetical protein
MDLKHPTAQYPSNASIACFSRRKQKTRKTFCVWLPTFVRKVLEGSQVSLNVSVNEFKQLFKGRYLYLQQPKSSTRGTTCHAYIQKMVVPPRYRQSITAATVMHQLCE